MSNVPTTMKTLNFTAAIFLLACAAQGQDAPRAAGAPSETVKKALPASAWLGIGMTASDGKVVISHVVPDSPAAKAGLKEGDILLRIGDTQIAGSVEQVIQSVTRKQPGDAVELGWLRGNNEVTGLIELAERPDQPGKDLRGGFRQATEEAGRAHREAAELPGPAKELKDETERALRKAQATSEKAVEKARQKLEMLKKNTRLIEPRLHNPVVQKQLDELTPEIELDPFKSPARTQRFLGEAVPLELDLGSEKDRTEFSPFRPFLYQPKSLEKQKDKLKEEAVWQRLRKSVAGALEKSGLAPDVREKVMQALEEARSEGAEQHARRLRLESEAAKLEKEMETLKERLNKLSEELKSGE